MNADQTTQHVVQQADNAEHSPDAFWSVWKTARRLLSSTLNEAFLAGMTGGALRHANAPMLRSDLTHWFASGLRFCGISAELVSLSGDAEERLEWVRVHARRNVGLPVFAFNEEEARPQTFLQAHKRQAQFNRGRRDAAVSRDDAEMQALTPPPDPVIAVQARVVSVDALRKQVGLEDAAGSVSECSLEELQTYFSHALLLQKGGAKGRRAEHRQYALRAWTTFACAYPDRLIGMETEDAILRRQAGDFWQMLAGKERSLPVTLLRDAADLFSNAQDAADIDDALRLLYKQTCLEMRLPPLTQNALLAPGDVMLSDAERRDLIYLARAGTRDLKILAAYRLWHEREQPDAAHTLEQLRYNADAWVRAVFLNMD